MSRDDSNTLRPNLHLKGEAAILVVILSSVMQIQDLYLDFIMMSRINEGPGLGIPWYMHINFSY